ncbi:MAG TPA: hypothetical protein VH679_15215 [Vicinamibacterales bacterium]
MIAAKGGHDRLLAVHAFAVSESATREGLTRPDAPRSFRHEFVFELPDRLWRFADNRPQFSGVTAEVVNRARRVHWTSTGGGPSRSSWSDGEANFMARQVEELQAVYFLETRFLQPTVVAVSKEREGLRSVTRVEAKTTWLARVVYTVDDVTHLPARVVVTPLVRAPNSTAAPFPGTPVTYELAEYIDVDGIKLPARDRSAYLAFRVNPNIDPQLFETPPDGARTADAWMKWLRNPGGDHNWLNVKGRKYEIRSRRGYWRGQ